MLQVWLLGQFQVRVDGKLANIPSRAAQSLLAYLILTSGTPHRREKLAGLLWPEMSDDNARNNLRHELWRVRKAITAPQFGALQSDTAAAEREYILAQDLTIAFNSDADYWLDVAQMEKPGAVPGAELVPGKNEELETRPESLISSLSLYRGELLPGFYDDWVGLERERAQAVFESKMLQLLEALVLEQRWQMVLEWGEHWIALGQTPEPAYRALMTAHSHLGDATKVAQDYERCLLALRQDLNVTPGQETQALYEELTRGAKTTRVRIAPLPEAFIQPSAPLTCVFTEIAEAASLLQALGEDYARLVQDQHELVRTAAEKCNGLEIDAQSDASFFGFLNAADAIAFAAEAQRAFAAHRWTHDAKVLLRTGIHSGEPMRAGISMDLHRAARIASAAHGGQTLVSQTTRELMGDEWAEGLSLKDLGEHRLKELRYPTHLYQLVIAGLTNDFPPLKTPDLEELPAPGEPPFKGLPYFDESDAALFFGREQVVSKLVDDLNARRFLAVVVGASGSGKSSVVRAGIIPALKRKGRWSIYVLTPTAHPLEALAMELTRDIESLTATATLLDDISRDLRALHLWFRRQAKNEPLPGSHRVLLAIDQFEELFTLCRDQVEREMFIDSLLAATCSAQDKDGRADAFDVTLLITIRADFYAHLAQYPELREAVAKQQEYIGPMMSDELRRAIEEPAKRGAADGAAWEFEPGVVDLMLRDVGDEPGALPLLSHALLETWKRRSGHLMTLKGYAEAGGVRGAIAHTAETTFQQLSPDEQDIVRGIFLRLTELGDATEDTRRRTAMAELVPAGEQGLATRAVLTRLADARLITTGEDTVEVAHEALIREWPRLREWLNQDREGLRLHRQLTEASQEWELLERDPGALYRGARLAQMLDRAALNPNLLNAHERAFLQASRAQEESEEQERAQRLQRELDSAKRIADSAQTLAAEQQARAEETIRANQRLRRRALFLVGALVLALVLAGVALLFGDRARANAVSAEQNAAVAEQNSANANSARLQAEFEKRTATARELAAAAIANLDVDPERSILLALQAAAATHQTDHIVVPEAEDALHQAVQTSRISRTFAGLKKPNFISFSPDETRLAVYSNGAIHVWDVASGKELITLTITPGNNDRMQFSRDGMRLATMDVNDEGPVATIFDLQSGAVLQKAQLHVPDYTYSDYSPDWTRIVVGSQDGTATLWDTKTGALVWTNTHPDTHVRDVAFSPDGKRIAAAFRDGTASVLDALTGKELLALRGHTESIDAINYNADGTRIGTASGDATAKVWDAATGKELLNLTGHGDLATDIKFSGDGTRILTTGLTRGGMVWDGKTGQLLTKLAGHTGFVYYGAISANGSKVVTSSSSEGTVRVWDLARSEEWVTVATTAPLSSQVFVAGTVIYNPDGTRFAVGLRDGRIKIWDSENGQEAITLQGHTGPVHRIAFSPDGTRLGSASSDGTARIWDVATGKDLTVIRASNGIVDSIAFSPDGKTVASGSFGHVIQLWDVDSGVRITSVDTSEVGPPRNPTDLIQNNTTWLAFSPDGQHLAASFGEGTVSNWDVKTGKALFVQRIGNGTWTLVFSPDGSRLAMSSIDVGAKVLDAATGKEIFALGGTVTPADHITYSHDGTRIATAHIGEAAAKVWDAATGKQLLTLYGDSSGVQSVDFSPDGSRIALASNNDIRIYLLDVEDLVALAKTRVTRELTTEECVKYLHVDACPSE